MTNHNNSCLNDELDSDTPDPIINVLHQLREQPMVTPADLHARCLATIPVRRPFWHRTKENFSMKPNTRLAMRFALASVAVSVVFVWTTQPHRTTKGSSYAEKFAAISAALAQSEKAMRLISYWHAHHRIRNMEEGKPFTKPPVVPQPLTSYWQQDEWFDKDRGSAWHTSAPGEEDTDTITLPSNLTYERGQRTIGGLGQRNILHRGDTFWASTRDTMMAHLTDPLRAVWLQPEQYRNVTNTISVGKWQEKQVRLITLEMDTNPSSFFWATHHRILFYVNPRTNLFMAQQSFVRWPDHVALGEVLESEVLFDYDRPDPSRFDIARIKQGPKPDQHVYEDKERGIFYNQDHRVIAVFDTLAMEKHGLKMGEVMPAK